MFRPSRMVSWVLLVVSVASAHARVVAPGQGGQAILGGGTDVEESHYMHVGDVRRYAPNQKLLSELQHNNVDVWAATPEYIEAFFSVNPNDSQFQDAKAFKDYPYESRPIYLPPSPSTHTKSLESPDYDVTLLNSTFHSDYHTTEEIDKFLKSLATQFSSNVSLDHIGFSYEGREILGVKIAEAQKHGEKMNEKHAFVILGAQHAREWVATSTALYLAHALAVSPHDQPKEERKYAISHLLQYFDFHIIPLPNPDGYEYTHTDERLWYKNRQPVSGGRHACFGIDMNRNWGYKWQPANDDPCSHWFPGHRPFESLEVNALAAYLTNGIGVTKKIAAFLDLRSYGQMISSPYSYSCDVLPADAEDLIEAALGAARASMKVHGSNVFTGRLCETLYSAPGNIIDWTYERALVKYSYATHLRDTGTYGFLLPKEWIRPAGEETTGLVDYLAEFIAKDSKTFENRKRRD